jgi:ketol-acid reductoisomerase
VLSACGAPNYQEKLQKELNQIRDSEMWRAGAAVRSLRPKEASRVISKSTKGMAGRLSN